MGLFDNLKIGSNMGMELAKILENLPKPENINFKTNVLMHHIKVLACKKYFSLIMEGKTTNQATNEVLSYVLELYTSLESGMTNKIIEAFKGLEAYQRETTKNIISPEKTNGR